MKGEITMSLFWIGEPQGRTIPDEELNFKYDEERYFLPDTLHGGTYILSAYAYNDENIARMEVKYLTPHLILDAYNRAFTPEYKFERDVFIDILNEDAETFIADNTPDDQCFSYLNNEWNTRGKDITVSELIEWATQHKDE